MGALDKKTLEQWRTALQSATGESMDNKDIATFLCDFNRLYSDDKIRTAESDTLLNRVQRVPNVEIDGWKDSLTKVIGGNLIPSLPNKAAALVVIVQQDILFKNQSFDSSASNVLRRRLETTPKRAVEQVVTLAGQESAMEETDAAISLAKYDSLYTANVFQDAAWDKILEEHKNNR